MDIIEDLFQKSPVACEMIFQIGRVVSIFADLSPAGIGELLHRLIVGRSFDQLFRVCLCQKFQLIRPDPGNCVGVVCVLLFIQETHLRSSFAICRFQAKMILFSVSLMTSIFSEISASKLQLISISP